MQNGGSHIALRQEPQGPKEEAISLCDDLRGNLLKFTADATGITRHWDQNHPETRYIPASNCKYLLQTSVDQR